MDLFRPVRAAYKAALVRLSQMRFPVGSRGWGWGGQHGWWNPQASPYARDVGDGSSSSIVVASVRWIGVNFTEAKPRVRHPDRTGELQPVIGHPLTMLLRRPNPFYSGMSLWLAILADWIITGNAYLYKIRSAQGRVVQLWWIPSCFMTPRWDTTDSTAFIDWYDYTIYGLPTRLDPRDVVHFRNGLDPQNTRVGRSPLMSVLTEIYSDEEAARYVAALLHNLGVPGAVISPTGDGNISPQDGEALKQGYLDRTTGSHRGEPLVIPTGVHVETFAFSPQQMDVKNLRRVPEERVTAVIGVPALVVGMGVGLDHATLANADTLNRMATENVLAPAWRFFGEEIQFQLLPEFDDPSTAEFDFDLSGIKSLQEDRTVLAERATKLWLAGVHTLNQTLSDLGDEPLGQAGEVRALPINVSITKAEDLIAPPPATPPPAGSNAAPADAGATQNPVKMLLERKSEAGWVSAVERLRVTLEPVSQREVQAFLEGQKSRVLASLTESKAALSDGLDWEHEDARLTAALRPTYLRALNTTTDLMGQYTESPLTVDDALVRSYLNAAGQRISGINSTTRRAIQKTLAEDGTLEEMAARIQALTGFDASRAEMIAVTELGASQALAVTHAAVLAGTPYLMISDPDGTDKGFTGCTDRHGKIVPASEGFNIGLLHPRCKMILVPVTRAPVTQRSNGHAHDLVTA